jgi:S-DNA-T family DNA segregation ATPase FtsK/SpoIIIE
MSIENPFRESRLNSSRDFRPEWDIPDLNQGITKWLVDEVSRLRGRKEPDPGQMIAVMTGPPGYGKTHLFGRIEHLVGEDVFFAFVPSFEPETPPLDHIRRHVIDSLFRVPPGGFSQLELTLARICRPGFADYFANLPPTLSSRHESLRNRLGESPEAVLDIVRQVKTLAPFLKLADSIGQIMPDEAGVIRALALGWAPSPWSGVARNWLRGEDLTESLSEPLGLSEQPASSLTVLRMIPALFGYQRPMMICCDQIEAILQGDSADSINKLGNTLMDLLQQVPVQIVMSCFKDQWTKFEAKSFKALMMRIHQPIFGLEKLTPEQAIHLVKARMSSWSGRSVDHPAIWPFSEASIAQLTRDTIPTPRGLIQECGKHLAEWISNGQENKIIIIGPDPVIVDPVPAFLQEWTREIDAIRQNPERSADNLTEDRLYRGILEALKLAQSAQRMRDFGGVRILEVRDRAIKATAPTRRPGAFVSISAGPGQEAETIVVALTKLEAARNLNYYFRAMFEAAASPVVGSVLIHPKRDLDLGGATRTNYDDAVKAGRLRLLPLEDYPMTYHSTECLASLIDRADARELVINGVTLSAEDCRDLVIKTGVIDNLDLFKMLGKWKRSAPKGQAAAEGGVASEPKAAPSQEAMARVSTASPVEPVSVAQGSKTSETDLDEWAEKKLAGAVKKLNLLGQGVEPDGFEIGPTFARIKVRPLGKTNFKAVSNKAVDLRISLGLEVVPIVGSQAGCISIDIQRPDRAVVSLENALANPPSSLDKEPAFPIGQDVAGLSHWLNLADPSDCHLLVAGTTGSGKSEFLRSIIASLANRLEPDRLQFILIDPKRVTFNLRGTSPYLWAPIAYDLDDALPIIERCMAEMERRYQILGDRKLSNVSELPADLLPRIVLIIDEFASFLEDKESKKIVTALLKRIGAMARAAGIHLILSTQRPDKDVITPLLRENLPGRIALKVSSRAGSDLILGAPDAENLLGKGDLFWKKGGELLRLQSPFVPQAELEARLKCQV